MYKLSPQVLVLLIFSVTVDAQNLVPNPSFENYSFCPSAPSQIYLLDDWNNPANSSPDYFNSCYVGPPFPGQSVPNNLIGYQPARTGGAYIGLAVHGTGTSVREYLQVLLPQPLIAGECYYVEMHTSSGYTSTNFEGISNVGVYLSENPPPVSSLAMIYATPQVYYSEVVTDTVNWVPLTGSFIANGGEQYLTIGNFFVEGTYQISPPNGTGAAYYFIEDIKLELTSGGILNIEETVCTGECFEYLGQQFCTEGTYQIPNSSGCASTIEINLTVDELANAIVLPPGNLGCNVSSVILDASNSTSGQGVNYQWTGPNNFSSTVQNPEVFDPGTYTLIVFGDGYCEASVDVEVLESFSPDIFAEVQGIVDCNNIPVTLAGSTNTPNVTFSWMGPGVNSNLPTVMVNQPGSYTLVVTAPNGCTNSETVSVIEDFTPPDISIDIQGILGCNNSIVTLFGQSNTPGVIFQWEGPGILSNDPIITTNQAGNYSLTVTAPNGCTIMEDITVMENNTPPDIITEVQGILDCNNSAVTLAGSSNTANVIFQWVGSGVNSSLPNITVNQAGNYALTITAPNGCTSTEVVTVFEDLDLPDISTQVSGTIDCNNSTVTLTGSSNTANVTFQWIGPGVNSNLPNITGSQAGSYELTITAPNGCANMETVTVFEELDLPDISTQVSGTIDCSNSTIALVGSSNTANVTFQWIGPGVNSTLQNITTNQSGIYTLTVTSSNGCTSSETVSVLENITLPNISAGVQGILDCENDSVTLSGSSTTSGVSYLWTGQGISETTPDVEVTQAGTYTLSIMTNNGCLADTMIVVNENLDPPILELLPFDTLDCVTTSVNIDASNSNGMGILNFEWRDEDGNIVGMDNIFNATISQNYFLIITDVGNGCTNEAQVFLEKNIELPSIGLFPIDTLNCNNLAVEIDASMSFGIGDLNFEWHNSIGNTIGTTAFLNTNIPGNYTLIVSDQNNGCTQEETIEVFQDIEMPSAIAVSSGSVDCNNNPVTLDASNSTGEFLNFEWLDANGDIISMDTTVDVFTSETYSLIVSNMNNGCSNLTTIDVEDGSDVPIANSETNDTLTCENLSVTLDGNGSTVGNNISYEWQNPSGTIISEDLQVDVDVSGNYILIVYNNDNGCSASSNIEVVQDISPPVAIINGDPLITCDEPVVILDGSASTSSGTTLTFQWWNVNNDIISTNETVDVDEGGIYTLVVFSENGCSSSNVFEVLLDTNIPVADVGQVEILTCENLSIDLGGIQTSIGSNIIYEWLDENNDVISTASTTSVTSPGIYSFTVTNLDNNCVASANIEILQDIENPIADAGNDTILNCVLTEISLDGSQSSMGLNFSYEWLNSNNDITSNELSPLINTPDTYTLVVTNTLNGCFETASVVIDQNIEVPIADAGNNGILTCDINELTLDGSNSTGNNLTYQWLNATQILIGEQSTVEVSQAGIYDLIVTNSASGCSTQSNVEVIPDDNLPIAIISSNGTLTCENNQVNLDGNASSTVSGNANFQWINSNGDIISNAENVMISTPGTYTLLVTDIDNGCSTTMTIEVEQDIISPIADAGQNQILTCDQTEVILDGTNSTGTNLTYEWQNDAGNSIANTVISSVSLEGTYFLIVTNNSNGCSSIASVEVIADSNLPIADAGNDELLTCEILEITLDGSASSTGNNIQYEWQNNAGDIIANTPTTLINSPGIYTLFIVDINNNCQTQDEVIITQDTNEPIAQIDFLSNQFITCNITSLVLDGLGSIPFGSVTYEWTTTNGVILSGANTSSPEVEQAGFYTLLVTNIVNGCTDTETIEVLENTTLPIAIITPAEMLTCVEEEIQINATGSSSNGNFIYSWTSIPAGGILSGVSTLQPTVNQVGTYTLTVIDNDNGCQSEAEILVSENITLPMAVASSTETLDCLNENIMLNGEGSSTGIPFTYQWTGNNTIDNSTTLSPIIYEPGFYTLIVTNNDNGCTSEANVFAEENENIPTAAIIETVDPLCYDDLGSLTIVSVEGGETPYLYSIDGGQNYSVSNIFGGLVSGNYSVLIQDIAGCELQQEVYIEPVNSQLNVELPPDVNLELGDDYQFLTFTNVDTSELAEIIWSPSNGLSCTNCLNPIVENIINGISYSITIINDSGCEASDEITLTVNTTKEVYIPNAFSPNEDGYNELFMIYANTAKVEKVNTFQIYDRWGALVFSAKNFMPNDPVFGWDGWFNSKQLNPAVFVYFAEIEFIDGKSEIFKGDVTLIEN
ncbi:MAG: gliding motility-associated C-terminal domain-containing protein [Saprospiraceae bacterium]